MPHEHGREEHDDERECESQQELEAGGGKKVRAERHVAERCELHDERQKEAVGANQELENHIGLERAPLSIHSAPEQNRA